MKRFALWRWMARVACALLFCTDANADELQLLWQIAPDEREYLVVATPNLERGVAYNPATGNVLLVSRGSGSIHIINGTNGTDIGTLNLGEGIISGGTFAMSMIGVTDDGVIYVANLSTSTTAPNFRLYRWENEAAEAPTIAFDGDPAGTNDDGTSKNVQRWGDSLDVRGAGTNTQVLIGSNAGAVAAILSTTNGADFSSTLIGVAGTSGATGVAFGSGDTIWLKKSAVALRQVSFNLATGVGTTLRTIPVTIVPNSVTPIAVNAASNWLAAISINAAIDDVRLYDISDPTNIFVVDQENFPSDQPNLNTAGSADFGGDILVALDTNNGLLAYRVLRTVTAPGFATQPASVTVLAGGNLTLNANVTGTRPISFQWQFEGGNIADATNTTLSFTKVSSSIAGSYTLIASNSAGSQTSSAAVVTIEAALSTSRLTALWNLLPGSRPYVTVDGNSERGLAYNKTTGRLLLVSRTSGVNAHVLDGETGQELWALQAPADVVNGGSPAGFRMNMIAVADDGAVYAANLDTGGTTYSIFRWENDSSNSIPTIAWTGAPVAGRRFGDTLGARGSGANTQLIAASNVAASEPDNTVAIFTTADGLTFEAVPILTAGVNDDAFRLGIAFGEGDTFWGKATTFPLQQVQFDLSAGTGTVLRAITNTPSSSAPLGVHVSSNLLALIAFQTPDNLRVYDTTGTGSELALADQELLPTDNANANGVGSVTFGNDRVYVLDTNNGIQAYKINPASTGTQLSISAPSMAAGTLSFILTGNPSSNYKIEATSDFTAWIEVKIVTTAGDGRVQVTDTPTQPYRFYRAVAQ